MTLATGTYNIRKLYMRETLNITGGSLTINYDPMVDPSSTPIGAQFSGPVTLSGSGSLNVNTLQVDAAQTFLVGGSGTLTFKQINLMPSATTPAKLAISSDVIITPLNNGTATIDNGSGAGNSGFVDLGGGTRAVIVSNGAADVDLEVDVPITNGNLVKTGAGTMRISSANTSVNNVTVNQGILRYGGVGGVSNTTTLTVNNGATLDMNGFADTIASVSSDAGNTTGSFLQGFAALTLSAPSGTATFAGTVTGTGMLTKTGGGTQVLSGNNTLGPVAVNGGALLFNGTNTTGTITVGNGGTVGGTGSVSGAVTVGNGGHIAPGASIESLGVGGLTLSAGSNLDFEFGAGGAADQINVGGLLSLNGGTLNLLDAGGMGVGTYTLINYGTLAGSVANLGTPVGPSAFQYGLSDTGSSIVLSVTAGLPGDFNSDGAVNVADYRRVAARLRHNVHASGLRHLACKLRTDRRLGSECGGTGTWRFAAGLLCGRNSNAATRIGSHNRLRTIGTEMQRMISYYTAGSRLAVFRGDAQLVSGGDPRGRSAGPADVRG